MTSNQLTALTNRSIRTIRNELEFLVEIDCITPSALEAIVSRLPSNVTYITPPTAPPTPAAGPVPHTSTPAIPHPTFSPPPSSKTPISEKYLHATAAPAPAPAAAPPSYTPTALVISLADAKWSFNGTEAGDLSFTAGDVIEVLEKIKDDWWKGRVRGGNGEIGLFPSSYVSETVVLAKEKAPAALPSLPPRTQAGYGPGGNMMTDVAHGAGSSDAEKKQGALAKNGEKFGKKLGNATIFGAGATMGGKIVNGIF